MKYKKKEIKVWIYKRPFLKEFLEYVSKNFETVLFSSSHQSYVREILKVIDPESKYFNHILN